MSVSGFTPPKVADTPSTGTSSGSLNTREPEATRQRLEGSASTAVSVSRSSAQLLSDLRATSYTTTKGAAEEASLGPGYLPAAGAQNDSLPADDLSEPEVLGSDSSSAASWQPRPRAETLSGPDLVDFQKMQKTVGDGFVAPGFHPTAPDASSSASRAHRVSSRASSVVGTASRQVAEGEKDEKGSNDDSFSSALLEEPSEPVVAPLTPRRSPDILDACILDAGRTSTSGLESQRGDFFSESP